MTSDSQTLINWIAAGLVFALVLSVWLVVLLAWVSRRRVRKDRIRQRLGSVSAKASRSETGRVLHLWREGREVATTAGSLTLRPTLAQWLERLRQDAGVRIPMPVLLTGFILLLVAAIVLAFMLTGGVISSVGVALGIVLMANVYLRHCIERRDALFEARFLDALQIAVRSLRAGHPLVGAFHFIAEEAGPPVNELFDEICQEQSLGSSLENAIRKVTARSTSPDLKLFASSVVVQLHSGGHLADMMERLAEVMRDRIRVTRRARVLTAQTQLSKCILLAMPVILFVLLNLFNPRYIEPLYASDLGKIILTVVGINLLIGVWVMNRMAVIRF